MWRNTQDQYGLITITLHWLIAIVVIGLFALGLWMVELDYYHPWYRRAPELHKSIGILVLGAMVIRVIWRARNPKPVALGKPWEQQLAGRVHTLLHALLVILIASGYLISTADGRPIEVFNWFSLPATLQDIENQEDYAGIIHEYLAYVLIAVAGIHAVAALKHHFLDKDQTLRRMVCFQKQSK